MASPKEIMDLGGLGVNVVKAPYHLDDRELLKAQNAEYRFDQGEGELSQRPGMSRINDTAVSTPAVSIFDVPLKSQLEYTAYVIAAYNAAATHNWRKSTDGTTWTDDDTPGKTLGNYASVAWFKDFPKATTLNNKLYFVDSSFRVIEYDGTTASILGTIPQNPTTGANPVGLMDIITDGIGDLWLAVLDATATEPDLPGRVLRFNPAARVFTQVGASFAQPGTPDGAPSALCFFKGLLVCGTYTGTTSTNACGIWYIQNPYTVGTSTSSVDNSNSWLAAETLAAGHVAITSLAVYKERLYIATARGDAVASTVRVCSETGTSSTVSRTGPAATALNAYTQLYVFNGELYAGWGDPGTTAARIEKYDDSSWTNDQTFATTDVVGQMVRFPIGTGSLYVVLCKTGNVSNTTSSIRKRTTGGTWSNVDDPADHFRGPIALLNV